MKILNKGEYSGDIIRQLSIDGSIITNTHYSAKKNNPNWHYHENLHICFVFQGGKAETTRGTTYTEKDGSIFFYHSEEKHRWISPQAVSKSANIEIGCGFLRKNNLSEETIKEALFQNADSKALIIKMQQEMLVESEGSPVAIHCLLLGLLSGSDKSQTKGVPHWVKTLNELLHDNWNKQMTLSEMAQVIGVHPVTISKYFRKYFTCTLGEYQRKLKIEKSIQLIKDSDMSLSEIGFYCGFTDQSHFIRNFKHMTSFTPKNFQRF